MLLFQPSIQWLAQNLFADATLLYIMGLISVLVYTYFDPQDER